MAEVGTSFIEANPVGFAAAFGIRSFTSLLKCIDSSRQQNKIDLLLKNRAQQDLLEIARLVAFEITERYRDQIRRLAEANKNPFLVVNPNTDETVAKGKWKESIPFVDSYDEDPPTIRVARFGVTFLLRAFQGERIKQSDLQKKIDDQNVVELFVNIISRSESNFRTKLIQKMKFDFNEILPLQKPLPQKDQPSEQKTTPLTSSTWILYDFYRKPTICPTTNGHGQLVVFNQPLPAYMDGTYGYRTGTMKERAITNPNRGWKEEIWDWFRSTFCCCGGDE